uniref:Uncharacterized protein n=1 Tax=Avena sativa TaxID=4498 RepID=A0ACD5WDL5_AVESA
MNCCLRSSRRLVLSCRPSSGAVRALPPQPMMLNTRYYSRLAASERPNIFGSIIPTSLSRHVSWSPAPALRRRYCTSDRGQLPRFDRWYHKPCKVAAAAALASAATAAAVCSRYDREIVPYTNRTHLVFMSPQSEIALWEPISIEEKKLWASQSQIVDPLHPDSVRVRLIADKVLRATYRTLDIESHKDDFKKDAKPQTRHLDGLNWEVILIKDDDANLAIEASPDGKIIVYTRLLDYFNTDAEIAFAIAQVGEIESDLRNRLTSAAASELLSLRVLLQEVQLSGTADHRTMLDGSSFSIRSSYAALSTQLQHHHLAKVWESFVPQKVGILSPPPPW